MIQSNSVLAAVKQAHRVCADRGARMTPLRESVFTMLLEAGEPVKAYDLLDRMRESDKSAKPPTIYRSLNFLMDTGLVHKVESLNAYIACTHSHHDGNAEFFICGECGNVIEQHTDLPPSTGPEGFITKHSVIEHYGTCATCQA